MPRQDSAQVNQAQAPASSLTRQPDGLYYTGKSLTYRITGLTPYNLDRLRITLKATPQNKQGGDCLFQIDTLDLYYSRAREQFADACAKYLEAQHSDVLADLRALITALEAERVSMREQGDRKPDPTMSVEEKQEAMEVLKSKNLLERIVGDFDAIGFIGEKYNKLLGYIAAVSRLLPDPVAVLVLSRSGAGKTSLQDAVCKFVPPESVIQYTRLTGQSLFYQDKNALKHKVLAIEEEEGMWAAMYSIKTLISSQKLSVSATRTDAKTGKFSVDEYTVHGPVTVMVSTTNPNALDDETKQRFLILTIDETAEQTRNILTAQRTKNSHRWYQISSDETNITKLHHNMQRLLRPLTVTFPDNVKISWPYGRLQMRREHGKFFSLIKAITLLHQYQRKTGTLRRGDGTKLEYVQATQADIDLALELGRLVFTRNVDDVSPTGRALLAQVVKLVQEKYDSLKLNGETKDLRITDVPFTRKELRETTGWSETQVRENVEPLVELGYLGRISGRHGSTYRYVLLDDGSSDPRFVFDSSENGSTKNQRVNGKTSHLRTQFVCTSQKS